MTSRVKPIYSDSFKRQQRSRRILTIILVMLLIGGGIWWWQHPRTNRPSTAKFPHLGVSLSQTDGYQDFQALKTAGVDFVYLKGTEGASYVDDNFSGNYDRAIGADMKVGVYHYFSFDSTPQAQAQQFINKVGQQIGQLPIAVSIQMYSPYDKNAPAVKETQQKMTTFVQLLEQHYQRKCIVYATASVLKRYVPSSLGLKQWVIAKRQPKLTDSIRFWQYSEDALIPKLDSKTKYNLSVFTGSSTQWSAN